MSLETRLNDPEYQNWLKCGQALLFVVNSLRQFTEATITAYHGALQKDLGHLGACKQLCKAKKQPDDGCAVCGPWKKKLLEKHSTKQVFWTNCDPRSWPKDRWEVAKIYMARGQKPNNAITAADLDSTHMFNLIKNCKEFHNHVPKKLPDKVLQKRNKIMHSSNMKMTKNDSQDIFDLFLQFLQDKKKLHELPETKYAVQQIQQLQKTAFDVGIQQQPSGASTKVMSVKDTKDLEHTLIHIMMADFDKRLEALENMEEASADDDGESKDELRKRIEDLQNFVNENADLKEAFGRDINSLKKKYDYLEERVEEINTELAELKITVDAFQGKPLPGAPAANYVSLLQQVTVELQIARPEYIFTPEELGQVCSVTVDGHTYRTNRAHRAKMEAKQDAAHIAYVILKEKIKINQHISAQPVNDPSNYIGKLQEYTQQHKLPKPEYHPKNKNTLDMLFTASVEVQLPDGQTSEFENPEPEKTLKAAKQAAAEQALKEIDRQMRQPQKAAIEKRKSASDIQSIVPTGKPAADYHSHASKQSTSDDSPKEAASDCHDYQPHAPKQPTSDDQHCTAKQSTSAHQPPVSDQSRGVDGKADLDDTNYKGKLQEHQQKLKLAITTYSSHTLDDKTFKVEVSVPLQNGGKKTFECETSYSLKKEAEQAAARKACDKLGILEEVKESEATETSYPKPEVAAGAVPKKGTERRSKSLEGEQGPSDPGYKNQLQAVLMRSHGATSPPKYGDVEIASQPGTFRSNVIINAKHMIQSGMFSSKKEAEKDVARLALDQLGQAQKDNPKGKLLQLYPQAKETLETIKIPDTPSDKIKYQSILLLAALENINEVVIFADDVGKTKKELKDVQKSLAKKVLDYLERIHENK